MDCVDRKSEVVIQLAEARSGCVVEDAICDDPPLGKEFRPNYLVICSVICGCSHLLSCRLLSGIRGLLFLFLGDDLGLARAP